ncbi:MAG: PD40 domain-containing protein [Deltaproteobacteria bacterium]|nr:PD40 domain-containing protein [Deltaproteobacteria bacterium]
MLPGLIACAGLAGAVEVSWVGGGHGSNPQWSSDGAWLAFEVNNNADKVDLYVVKVANGAPAAPTRVAIPGSSSSFSGGGSFAANPVWHPKQSILIFEAANSGGTTRLYYFNPGSGSPAEYLNAAQAPGMLAWPAISPDGMSVAFTSSSSGAGDVFLFSQQTNKVALAFPSTKEPENAPKFAPDGKTVVFSRKSYGTEDVFSMLPGASAAGPVKGATGNGDQTRPRVAGSNIIYFTGERGDDRWDIGIVPLVGGDRRILARDIRLPQRSAPNLSADGTAVLYGSSEPARDGSVYICKLDGTGITEVKTGLSAVGDPAMISAGGKTFLAFTALPAAGSDWRQLHIVDVTGKY